MWLSSESGASPGMSRLKRLFFGQPREVDLPVLAKLAASGGLALGLTQNARQLVALPDPQLLTNLLVLGAPHLGARAFLEHLICQQVGRGGGVLVLDPVPSTRLPVLMDMAARVAGRTDFEWLPAEPHPTKVAEGFCRNGVTYVSLNFLAAPRESRAVSRYLQLEFQQAMVERAAHGPRPSTELPFMVVLPQVSVHASPRWAALAGQARALRVCLVMQENSFMETQLAGEYFFASVLKHTGTKVLLPADSAESRGLAAERLTPLMTKGGADVQRALRQLRAGDALVMHRGLIQPFKTRGVSPSADAPDRLLQSEAARLVHRYLDKTGPALADNRADS